jgi:hypothetical protein
MAGSDISLHDRGRSPAKTDAAPTHARSLILRVCHIAGTAVFIDEAGLGPVNRRPSLTPDRRPIFHAE